MTLIPTNDVLPNSSPATAGGETTAGDQSLVSEAPRRVALVDDDALFRESLGLNLIDEGFDVVAFAGGDAVLAFLGEGGRVDLVLLDWRMPKMDGIEVLRRIRAQDLDVPVIFLTVLSDQMYEEAALVGGAVDFVEKSRRLPILLKRINLILDGRKAVAGEVGPGGNGADGGTFQRGSLDLRIEGGRALWRGVQVDLTLTEFNIVRTMATRIAEDVSYREIYDLVHSKGFVAGYGPVGYRANVRAFIKRIRQKFRMVDPDFDLIENYPGFGYRWGEESDIQSDDNHRAAR
ncbi:MAG: response regulator transcription factor [Azospirillaceae bacterium]|nr:response regulator transcription factor [Azospirillaceae bacterium]